MKYEIYMILIFTDIKKGLSNIVTHLLHLEY
jgi:hypothetical protein